MLSAFHSQQLFFIVPQVNEYTNLNLISLTYGESFELLELALDQTFCFCEIILVVFEITLIVFAYLSLDKLQAFNLPLEFQLQLAESISTREGPVDCFQQALDLHFQLQSHSLTIFICVVAQLLLLLSQMLQSLLYLIVRRAFALQIIFFPFARLLILNIQTINFDIVSQAVCHFFEIFDMGHILEVLVNEFYLLALIQKIKAQSAEKLSKVVLSLFAGFADTFLLELSEVGDLGIAVFDFEVKAGSFELFVLGVVVVVVDLFVQEVSQVCDSLFFAGKLGFFSGQ